MMVSNKKAIEIVCTAIIALILMAGIASAVSTANIGYNKGMQIKQQPSISGVQEIQFIAECGGVMTITNTDNKIDILSSCKPRGMYVQFIVPNGKAVYQTKDADGKKVAIKVLQKQISVSTDGAYHITLTKPENVGRFEFMNTTLNQDDDFIVEDAADQNLTIRANLKSINIETLMQKDEEIYKSLQATNLSSADKIFFNRVKNTIEAISKILNSIIGGKKS